LLIAAAVPVPAMINLLVSNSAGLIQDLAAVAAPGFPAPSLAG
jgi:hypothetical protein